MPELADLHVECSGERCTILFMPRVCKGLEKKADAQDEARIRSLMRRYATTTKDVLIDTQFRFEGRFKSGRPDVRKIAIYAFKAHQLRVYGGFVPATKFFLCGEIDVKKQNAADMTKLESTANTIAQYVDLEEL